MEGVTVSEFEAFLKFVYASNQPVPFLSASQLVELCGALCLLPFAQECLSEVNRILFTRQFDMQG
ncbi:hypothetical protein RSAG8_10022, partial [Rhizoctonia solani AG-8 WAC10335]